MYVCMYVCGEGKYEIICMACPSCANEQVGKHTVTLISGIRGQLDGNSF